MSEENENKDKEKKSSKKRRFSRKDSKSSAAKADAKADVKANAETNAKSNAKPADGARDKSSFDVKSSAKSDATKNKSADVAPVSSDSKALNSYVNDLLKSGKTKEDRFEEFFDTITKAAAAESSGDSRIAAFLYLAAYEIAVDLDEDSIENAVLGLKNAWNLTINKNDTLLSELIFDSLSDHLDDDEYELYDEQLHSKVVENLDKLGFSTDMIEGGGSLAEALEQMKEFAQKYAEEYGNDMVAGIMQGGLPGMEDFANQLNAAGISDGKEVTDSDESKEGLGASGMLSGAGADGVDEASEASKKKKGKGATSRHRSNKRSNVPPKKSGQAADESNNKNIETVFASNKVMRYKDLIGFDDAISEVKKTGLGMSSDSQYNSLIQRLNKEHGLERVSFSETLVFVSESRVDAKLLMEATAGEIGLPCMRMHVDENIAGANVLTLMGPADSGFQLNPSKTGFNGKGILLLEDIDNWDLPDFESLKDDDDERHSFLKSQIARGVFEVLGLISVAINNPNIIVMASMVPESKNDKFVKNTLEPYREITIDFPTVKERVAIWSALANDHPSLRAFSTQKLVRLSANMSRYDINVAAHDALEDAYKKGIEEREYVPLTIMNIVEKLAEHQSSESVEYKDLEDVAISNFRKGLENIDDILND